MDLLREQVLDEGENERPIPRVKLGWIQAGLTEGQSWRKKRNEKRWISQRPNLDSLLPGSCSRYDFGR